jgi:O-antigen/teichoic acid export membrane protein
MSRAETHAVPGRVWRGTALLIAGRVWSALCTLAILKLGADHLSPAAFGTFTFYLALFSWLDSVVNLGTAEVAVQRTADDPGALLGVLAAARRIRLRMGLISLALVAAVAFLAREPGAGWIALAALYPITHTLELSTTVFKNRIAWGLPVAVRALATTLSLLGVWTAARQGVDQPALYLVAVAAGSTVGNLLLYLTARPHLPRPIGPVEPASGIFSAAWPLGMSSICAMGYYYVDNVYIRVFRGEEELGPYNVAVRVMSLLIMVAQYASLSALPWLRRRHARGDMHRAIVRIGPVLFALAGLGAGAVWPWTDELLERFREGFGFAGPSLRWLLCGMASIYAGSILLTAVVAAGLGKAKLRIQACGLVFNLLANAWAVPRMGIEGAGLTTFLTEALVAVGAGIALQKRGVPVFARGRWLLWAGGPALFALAAWLSAQLPLS